jgi:hypothetical protein
MHKLKLDWRIGELERRTLYEYVRTVGSEFERLGLGSFNLSQVAFLDDSVAWVCLAQDSVLEPDFSPEQIARFGDLVNPRVSDCACSSIPERGGNWCPSHAVGTHGAVEIFRS